MSQIILPRAICASCLLTCYDGKDPEPYYVCIERWDCNCPYCRHQPTWGLRDDDRRRARSK